MGVYMHVLYEHVCVKDVCACMLVCLHTCMCECVCYRSHTETEVVEATKAKCTCTKTAECARASFRVSRMLEDAITPGS